MTNMYIVFKSTEGANAAFTSTKDLLESKKCTLSKEDNLNFFKIELPPEKKGDETFTTEIFSLYRTNTNLSYAEF